jgi:hypothetical protein
MKFKINRSQENLLIAGAVIGVAYLGIIRPVLLKLGIGETAAQKAQRLAQQNALASTFKAAYAKQSPTKSDGEWLIAADTIFNSLRSPMPLFNTNDTDTAGYQIARPQNDADVYKLIEMFGKRSQTLFGIDGPEMSLPEFVSKEMPADKIATVNNNFSRKGIKFRW